MPRTMAAEILCRSQCVSLLSPVTPVILCPISDMSFPVDLPQTPVVSKARGSNLYRVSKLVERCLFLSSALLAAAPAVVVDSLMMEGAKVSPQVASQQRYLPAENGKVVIPSGRFPSPWSRPTGLSLDRIPIELRERLITSFK